MDECYLRALMVHRPALRRRWEVLLRQRPIVSPLGHPDSLVYLMDWTLDNILAEVRKGNGRRAERAPQSSATVRASCRCHRNPLLDYFETAKIAFAEMFRWPTQEPTLPGTKAAAEVELTRILDVIMQREIETFCAVCQRQSSPGPDPAETHLWKHRTKRVAATKPNPVS